MTTYQYPPEMQSVQSVGVQCNLLAAPSLQKLSKVQEELAVWEVKQSRLLAECKARGTSLSVGGDGRADSPSHSAKYGSWPNRFRY